MFLFLSTGVEVMIDTEYLFLSAADLRQLIVVSYSSLVIPTIVPSSSTPRLYMHSEPPSLHL